MAAPASGSIPVLVLGGATGPAHHFQFPCDIRGDGRVNVDPQSLSTALGGHVGAVRLLLHQGRVIRCRKGEGTFACNPEYAILVVPSSSASSSAPDSLMRSANEMNDYDTARNKKRKRESFTKQSPSLNGQTEDNAIELSSDGGDNDDNDDNEVREKTILSNDIDESTKIKLLPLTSMGFSLKRSIEAMESANGNLEAAAAMLLDGKVLMPSSRSSSSAPAASSSFSSTSPLSSSASSLSSSTKASASLSSSTNVSMFDGHEDTVNLRRHVSTAIDYDESLAYSFLPRHGFMLESIAQYPEQFLGTLLKYGHQPQQPLSQQGGEHGISSTSQHQSSQSMVVKIRRDEKAMLDRLFAFGETFGLSQNEISNYWLICDRNEAMTKSLLESL